MSTASRVPDTRRRPRPRSVWRSGLRRIVWSAVATGAALALTVLRYPRLDPVLVGTLAAGLAVLLLAVVLGRRAALTDVETVVRKRAIRHRGDRTEDGDPHPGEHEDDHESDLPHGGTP